jgi:hypothetical protein
VLALDADMVDAKNWDRQAMTAHVEQLLRVEKLA